MCDEWRRIDELAGLVIGRLEFVREGAERPSSCNSLNLARSTAVERVATDSQREGRLPVARAQGEGGDPPNAICETGKRTGAAKAPAKFREIKRSKGKTPDGRHAHKDPCPANRPVLRVIEGGRGTRTASPAGNAPPRAVCVPLALVVGGGH